MSSISNLISKLSFICLGSILIYGCSSQRESVTNRGLQNLSAKYNYIYNSNILLSTYQEELARTNKDNYENLLAVYIAPAPVDYLNAAPKARELEDITKKAQAIIAEKNLSNYLDEAYLLLGKTNFYNSEYFNAVAYFNYTANAFKEDKKVYLEALNWKARSLMQMNNLVAASKVLDTVKMYLDSVKSNKAAPLATLAQMSIHKNDYKEAIAYLKLAKKETSEIQSRTRWPYILAQLYEREKEYDLSLRNYSKVENSNAPFEMYFNAKLSKIRINDALNKLTTNRKQALLKLLKDEKNLDYTDQIYYEVAEDYYADKDFEQAIHYYQLSAQKSTINPNQKGLSYLKIAELNFKDLRDYVSAKLYYDSAVTTLPKNYPNYESIANKGQNLEFLTERYQIISDQDTLQAIAKLSEKDRAKKLDIMFEPKKEEVNVSTNNANNPLMNGQMNNANSRNQTDGTFYFSNLTAISKGYPDFKKRWGNRSLEDNWRQSVKSSGQINQQNQTTALNNTNDTVDSSKVSLADTKAEQIKKYLALLPVTAEQLTQSNEQIIDAYFEIANFYQQVIKDQQEATRIYELLLERFPQNRHLETINYSLYLAYKDIDQAKADIYKNVVLSKYPNSLFAKTILDPNFSAKQNALEVEINKIYNATFEAYEKKDFEKVISSVNEVNQRFPGNNLQAQFDYLKAIAIGRTQYVDSLLTAFNEIITNYPDEQLITPLAKDHVAYIIANLPSFKARAIALLDFDPTEPPFISKQVVASTVKPIPPIQKDPVVEDKPKEVLAQNLEKPSTTIPLQTIPETKIEVKAELQKPIVGTKEEPKTEPVTVAKPVVTTPAKQVINNIFSLAESNSYFYVIAVADASLNVSSSRFGIGQFNRGTYAEENLRHQLIELAEDQLIYIGDFSNLKDVKAYYTGITALLPKVMKIPTAAYAGFYISKENFSKLKDKETITQYLEFFKNNY